MKREHAKSEANTVLWYFFYIYVEVECAYQFSINIYFKKVHQLACTYVNTRAIFVDY